MTKVMNLAKRFVADEEGAALVEYTVLIGIMLVAVIRRNSSIERWLVALGNPFTNPRLSSMACPIP